MAVTYWDPQPNYRGFLIHRTDPQPPIPTWAFDWSWAHEETATDGPDIVAYGHGASPEDCREAIDEWWEDQEYDNNCNECVELEEICQRCLINAAFVAYREP